MKTVPLTQGQVALVDDEDFELVSKHKWYAAKRGYRFYAQRRVNRRIVQMHRLLTKAPTGLEVDHINGNTLDNRRSNLRLATRSQNEWNRNKQSNNTSGFKGVIFSEGKYKARIRVFKKLYFLGSFEEKEKAALAYNNAAKKYHGEFANLNAV